MIVARRGWVDSLEESLFSLTGTADATAFPCRKRSRTWRGASWRSTKWRNGDWKSDLVFRLVSLGPPPFAILSFCGLDALLQAFSADLGQHGYLFFACRVLSECCEINKKNGARPDGEVRPLILIPMHKVPR